MKAPDLEPTPPGLPDAAALLIELWPVDRPQPYAKNARRLSPRAVDVLAASIREFGFRQPIVVDSADVIVVGHTRLLAARKLGLETVPVHVALNLTPAQCRAYRLADNRTSDEATWDPDILAAEFAELEAMEVAVDLTAFEPAQVEKLLKPEPIAPPDATPEAPKTPVSLPGDLWLLGKHRVLCGDATNAAQVSRLLGDAKPDTVITDPPYCSGGFQEAGRGAGSIGSDAKIKRSIANDTLSTRGYISLIKSVLGLVDTASIYIFTDWRMWVNLFDVIESSGFGVRNMIVWDKGSPGMGRGWRSQHELIMFGVRAKVPFDGHKAVGNVIPIPRTGNPDHPTQKPVELIAKVLEVSDWAQVVYDPFAGSGTTLIACEQASRQALCCETDRPFADVIVARWQQYTGLQATLDGDGRTFEQIAVSRLNETQAKPEAEIESKAKTAPRSGQKARIPRGLSANSLTD